jgi:hypothetical protein
MDLAALFPDLPEPNVGPGVSYSIAKNALMHNYVLVLPGQRRMRGCLRAVDEDDARRILMNRHPKAIEIEISKGQPITSNTK